MLLARATARPVRRLALALLALGLAACSTGGGASGGPRAARIDQIVARGTLRAGLTADQPPLNMRNRSGELVGMEVDLLRALAASMELELEFVEKPFADLLPALEKGEVDLVASGVTITPERNARVAFAGPYFVTGMSMLARSETMDGIDEPDEIDDPRRTYAALAGSTSELFTKKVMPRARLVATPNYEEAIAMVIDGRADAMVADFLVCELATWRHRDTGLATLDTPLTAEPIGIALPADDPLFVNLVDNYLDTLEHTGILMQLKARWFSDGGWVAELP